MRKKGNRPLVLLGFSLFVFGLMGCLSDSGSLEEHNSGVVYQHRQSELLKGATEISSEEVISINRPLAFVPSAELSESFKLEKNRKGQIKLYEKPILALFLELNQKGDLDSYKKWLAQKSDSSKSTYVKPFQDCAIIPYQKSEALLESYIKQDFHFSQLPPIQWAAGMFGADSYLLFSIEERKVVFDYRLAISVSVVMTYTGKTVYHIHETLKLSPDQSEVELNRERERFFDTIYRTVMKEATLSIAENLAVGKYRQLVFNKAKGNLNGFELVNALNKERGVLAKEVAGESADLVFDIWSGLNESDFEALVARQVLAVSKGTKNSALIMQDRMVYFFEVEKVEKK